MVRLYHVLANWRFRLILKRLDAIVVSTHLEDAEPVLYTRSQAHQCEPRLVVLVLPPPAGYSASIPAPLTCAGLSSHQLRPTTSSICAMAHHDYHKHKYRPLSQYRYISATACISLLLAFALYLVVALSIPIIKPVYLFIIDFNTQPDQPPTSIATDVRFGVWGFCASSVLDLPTIFTNNGECTDAHLGYEVAPDLLELTGYPQLAGVVLKTLTVLLVLHPVCAALSFLSMLTSLFLASGPMTITSLILSIFTGIIGSVTLAADLALEIEARQRIGPLTNGAVTVGWGNGVWMIVVAVAFTWLSVILLSAVACRCCGYRKHHHHHHHSSSHHY